MEHIFRYFLLMRSGKKMCFWMQQNYFCSKISVVFLAIFNYCPTKTELQEYRRILTGIPINRILNF